MVKLQEAENQIIINYEVYGRRPNDSDLLVAAIETHQAVLWTMRSRMASAKVGSLMKSCHLSTGSPLGDEGRAAAVAILDDLHQVAPLEARLIRRSPNRALHTPPQPIGISGRNQPVREH
jgi:hypothetical protein